ncbi:MAG: OmpA family protein [Vicingaceae bacterium]
MEYKRSNTQILKHTLSLTFALLLGVFFFSCSTSKAQNYTSQDRKAVKLFEEAKTYYQKREIDKTKELLLEAVEKDNQFIEALTLLAYIYMDAGKFDEAKASFKKTIAINPTAIPNNLFFLGEIELNEGNYEEASLAYSKFIQLEQVDPKLIDRSRESLTKIDFALASLNNPVEFSPKNLGPEINSEYAEYFPCLTVDQNTLLFTRRLPNPESPQGFNEDFYVAYKKGAQWTTAQNIHKPINTEFNEGAPSLSADGQILFFTACELYGNYGGNRKGNGSCDIFYAAKNGKNWTRPINLGKAINTNNWETQPSFSADGKTLYFIRGIRDRSGKRTGDIYVSTLDENNFWSKPQLLSATINTSGNEESVFIHPDGKTLFFSSDGHLGMGGLDIFMVKKDSVGNWGEPINLGYPINTHKNENSLLVSADGTTAFFASDREEGYGELDLYSFDLPKQFAPAKVSYFAGKIYDSETKEPLAAKFELIDLDNGEMIVESFSSKSTGEFLVSLPSGRNYALNASKEGYLFYSENFELKQNASSKNAVKKDVPLQPIKIGEKIILKNIFFETAKFNLKPNSKIELDKLSEFLKANDNLKIEISGHTDNVGNAAANKTLSLNRAKSVYNYLVDSGVPTNRLEWVGYGEEQPIAENTTAEGKAQNRRTEFKVVGIN